MRKDVEWNIHGKELVIRNVPYKEGYMSDSFTSEVAERLEMLARLMYKDDLPYAVDFETVEIVE